MSHGLIPERIVMIIQCSFKIKSKIVPVLKHHTMKAFRKSGGDAPGIPNFYTRWR
jgi:hypothetical protein